MSDRYDVIVIGAGHNGLTAAALLARAGRRTLVLERRSVIGGLAAGDEFHTGYRTAGLLHDTTGVRSWVTRELGLEKHGLRRQAMTPPVLVPRNEGEALLLWRDPARAAQEIARFSPADAGSYEEYRAYLDRIGPVLRRLLDNPPPDVFDPGAADLLRLGRSALALRRLGHADMMELLRAAPMSLADWLGERFESEAMRAALAAPAIHNTYTGPRSPGGTANLLRAECMAEAPVEGGPAALAEALEKAARTEGAEIRTGTVVVGLLGGDGRVTGVRLQDGETLEARSLVASCDPRQLFLHLLPRAMASRGLERGISGFRARGTAAKVHLALSGYPEFTGRPGLEVSAIRIGETLDALERAFDAVKYRRFSERPILDIQVPTVESPELAPPGHHVFSILVHFAPFELEAGWSDSARDELVGATLDRVAEHAPSIRELVVGHEVLTPPDLESRFGVSGGHLYHGEHALDQLLVRPTPECARYATPFEGLYLGGSGAHPGGGFTCAPGALAARTVLAG